MQNQLREKNPLGREAAAASLVRSWFLQLCDQMALKQVVQATQSVAFVMAAPADNFSPCARKAQP